MLCVSQSLLKMGNYKRQSQRMLRFTNDLLHVIKLRLEKGESKHQIAKSYGIPEATLRKRLKLGTVPTSLGRYEPVFNIEMELQLVEHVKKLDNLFYGLTVKEPQLLTYQFAEQNKISHPFNKETKMVGKGWIKSFCERHNLTLRQPEKVSAARASGFNKNQVSRFFENLQTLYKKYQFKPQNIYNMDETGLLTVPNKTPKIICQKGKKSIGKIVSAERGVLITAVCCFSAGGNFIPPVLIFPRKRIKPELIDGAPPGSLLMVSDSDFINTDLFYDWIQHFQSFAKSEPKDPVLLILDNHSSHINLDVINYCRNNSIFLLSIPPHSSHKLQPLDVGFFGPLKTMYAREADYYMTSHPGRVITQYQIASLFGKAYGKIASLEKAQNSFKQCSIWPIDLDVFSEVDFAPATVTDKDKSENNVPDENAIDEETREVDDEGFHVPDQESYQMINAIPHEIVTNAEIIIEDSTIIQELNEFKDQNYRILFVNLESQAKKTWTKYRTLLLIKLYLFLKEKDVVPELEKAKNQKL